MASKKHVIVLGGGVAGMSTAHELAERGFQVTVYEKHVNYPGGKARSVNVPATNLQSPDMFLPGEHGFRFFPGFYKHITDTMKRIPFSNNKDGVFDNLVAVNRAEIARFGKKPIEMIVNFPKSLSDFKVLFGSMHSDTGLTEAEKELFATKIWQLMTSCHDRRNNEYERIGWWQFMDADNQSKTYQSLLVEGLTRTLVAANAKYASTKTGGDIFLQLIFNIANPFTHTDRVLNGPTNDVWLNPWLDYLKKLGVEYHNNYRVASLKFENGLITGAFVHQGVDGPMELVSADYFVLATPVEAAAPLISLEMMAFDQTLKGIKALSLSTAWMNGIQFYLNEDVQIVAGHCIYSDSPWALTSISQIQFWGDYDLSKRYNGKVKGILSIDVSDWEAIGLNGKAANACSSQEIKDEVWAQLKKSLNYDDVVTLRDDMIEFVYLDNDIYCGTGRNDQDVEPLLVNHTNTWCLRPEAWCRIPNLYFASDYVRTYTDLATMEGANEAARRAVNGILDDSGSDAEECEIWNLHEPDLLAPLRWHDAKRYADGLAYRHHENFVEKAATWVEEQIAKLKGKI